MQVLFKKFDCYLVSKVKNLFKNFFWFRTVVGIKTTTFFLILNLKTIVWILTTFWGLLFCQKWAWVEDWKKILCQHHHNIQVYNIFFQSSSLDQKDHEIRRLMERKKIICKIVEWEFCCCWEHCWDCCFGHHKNARDVLSTCLTH